MKTTSDELLMYATIKQLEQIKAPFVFKGGLITKAILSQNDQDAYVRTTKDIDANWIGKTVTIEQVCEIINEALKDIDNELKAIPFRDFDEERSAGIKVVNTNNETVFKLDIDMNRPVAGISSINIDNTEIRCVDAKQIIADKICAVSGNKIFRRAKDMIDLYALSACISFTADEIKEIAQKTNHIIGDFACLLNNKEELRHAYEKLQGMDKKPDFEEIYDRVCQIAEYILQDRAEPWEEYIRSDDHPLEI